MQNHVDIFPRNLSQFRRYMLKAKFSSVPVEIDNERPAGVTVTITAHNDQRRTDRPQLIQNPFRANISQMPDLVRFTGKIDDPRRQFIVSISEDEDLHGGSASPKTMLNAVRLRRLNKHRVRDNAIHLQRTSSSKHQKLKPIGYWGIGNSPDLRASDLELTLCVSASSA
jgi:hypothetical protein